MLTAVSMVKDESDIIEYTIRHLFASGVDQVIVADNLSTDTTPDILARLSLEYGDQLMLLEDDEPAYIQAQKMTKLYDIAVHGGADFVIPFDADELWCSPRGNLALDLLSVPGECDGVVVPMFNHFPTYADPFAEKVPNPFERLCYRHRPENQLPKVIVRSANGVFIHQGNHSFSVENRVPFVHALRGLHIRHFPYRSEQQFTRKAFNGAEAYKLTDLPADQGAHWRMYGQLYDRAGEAGLREHFRKWFFFGPERMSEMFLDPAPYREHRLVTT